MTWGLQQRDYPILTPGQMNPFNQAFQSGLQAYSGITKAAYEPMTLQANAAAKAAYAKNYQRQLLSTMLSNPALIARMSTDQLNGFLGQYNNMAQGGGGGASQLDSQSNEPGLLTKFGKWIGSFGQGSNENKSPSSSADAGYSYDANGNNVKASPQEISNAGNTDLSNNNQFDIAKNMIDRSRLQLAGNVMTGSGKGVGQGTTYNKPGTNEDYSSATTSTANNVQTALLTSERVAPFVKDLANQYEKSFSIPSKIAAVGEQVGSALGLGNETPHVKAGAQFQSDIVNAADGFLKELNLNNTTGNRQSMEKALSPGQFESAQDYRKRINWLWNVIQQRDKAGRKILADGILLNPNMIKSESGRETLTNMSQETENISKEKQNNNVKPWEGMAVNEAEVQGQVPPKGTKWMIRPDGMQVAVHTNNIPYAKSLNYRDID